MSAWRLPRRGVTLLEILVAVVILSVATVSLTAAVRQRRASAVDARVAAQQLASLLRSARMTAIAKQANVQVRLGNDNSAQWLALSSSSSLPTAQPIVIHAELPPNVTVAPWPSSLTFNPQGLPDQGLNAWVTGTNSRFRIVVYAASGIVRVDTP